MDTNTKGEGICVAIRMRPLNDKEISTGQEQIFKCNSDNNSICQCRDSNPVDGQTFFFDQVFNEKSTTTDVYSHVGKDIVKGVMSGINGTIFACKSSLLLIIPYVTVAIVPCIVQCVTISYFIDFVLSLSVY